jgi:GT2 family glycosyltransferase
MISAIVTAYERVEQTLATLRVIQSCVPPPDEVLVHVDANQHTVENAIRDAFPGVRVLRSEKQVGPGGGRNKLVEAVQSEFVASFDDDSYPIDSDYFARTLRIFEKFPEVSVICAALYHAGESIGLDEKSAEWTADFQVARVSIAGRRFSRREVMCRCPSRTGWKRWISRSGCTRRVGRS